MYVAWQCLLLCALGADPDPATHRYLKAAGGKWVLESEVTRSKDGTRSRYVSRTVRGALSMTLTVLRDESGRLTRAETLLERGDSKQSARLVVADDRVVIRRGEMTERLDAPLHAVVTTAPDWTDVLELVHAYDRQKGGLQEFPGLWFHPANPTLRLTFEVERLGTDTVQVSGKAVGLTRFRVKLRSGNYTVWGLADGRVCKILPPGKSSAAVVLEGYEEAVHELK